MTALAALVLKESVGWRRWSAALVGFLGVTLVAKPGAGALDGWVLVGLGVAFLVALRDLVTRFTPAGVSTSAVTLMTTLTAGAAAATLAPFEIWRAPTSKELALCAAAAFCTTMGNIFIIRAFRMGEASVVSPFRYVVIPIALMWGYLAFGEAPDAWAIGGIALIAGAGIYTLHRERVRARDTAKKAA
jgi:drug/metabolite transporter (DMT)-like permease